MKFTIKLDSQALKSSHILRFLSNSPDSCNGHDSKPPFHMHARHLSDHLDSLFKACLLNRTHSSMAVKPLADYNETLARMSMSRRWGKTIENFPVLRENGLPFLHESEVRLSAKPPLWLVVTPLNSADVSGLMPNDTWAAVSKRLSSVERIPHKPANAH